MKTSFLYTQCHLLHVAEFYRSINLSCSRIWKLVGSTIPWTASFWNETLTHTLHTIVIMALGLLALGLSINKETLNCLKLLSFRVGVWEFI